MPYHFYLPELDSNSNITVPKETAHWFNNDKKIILGISDGIVIDEQAKTKGISSIPDIWARPLLFQSALKLNSKHPLKKRCIQEWRGLLSIIALHRIKPALAPLEIVAVPLGDEKFSKALKNLTPKSIQLEKGTYYDWKHILMIRFNGIPLGAFSPTTLVYTGADYAKKIINESFSFKDSDGYLLPPQTKEDGLDFVGEWLYQLQERMTTFFYSDEENEPDRQIIQNIRGLINEWLAEIRLKLGLKENEQIDVEKYRVAEEPSEVKGTAPFLNNYNIYLRLLHPLKADEEFRHELSVSDILLQSTRKKESKILVITEKLLSDQINIWKELRPKDLGDDAKTIVESFFKAPSGKKISNIDIGEGGGLWIRPELYFLSDKLLKSRGSDILNPSEEELNLGTKYVLPFKKEILDFFSPQEIKEKLNPSFKEDSGMVKFTFSLPVGNLLAKVEKTYRAKISNNSEGEIVDVETPVIEIFPDYLGSNWNRYYLFQGKAENFFITPLLEEKLYTSNYRDREYKQPENSQKIRIFEISGEKSFPEALEIANETRMPFGVVLLEKKEKTQGLKHKWTVGIDFGTSNTNVYKNRGSADSAERWCYNFPEYYRSITQADPTIRKNILEEYFFPTRVITLPIPTTLKIYNLAKKDSMVLDYFIYYPIEYKFPENVLSEIKWEGEGERKTEYFLESLMFLLLIEIVKNGVEEVHLACSYPKAFSATNITVFKREWEAVFDKLLKADEFNHVQILNVHNDNAADNQIKIKLNKPVFRTEGIAAGEFFASELTIPDIKQRANKEIAAICLDVGGGTTDISIWYLNHIEFDASVLLAGRQISNLLQRNNRVRELLFSKSAAIALEEKKNEPGYFNARLNLILKTEEDLIQEMLVKHANNKDINWLRQIIALEFGALSFYAAQVCISTNEHVGGLLSRISEDGINLHWGGNAAKLINWIDFGKYNREGIASKILNATFFNCLNDLNELKDKAIKAKALSQLQSPGHKSEASGGLVVMDLDRSEDDKILGSDFQDEYSMPEEGETDKQFFAGIVSGENIELTDKTVQFYTPITNKDLFDQNNRTKFKLTTLDRLIRFVDVLNFFGVKNGLFTEDTKIFLGEEEKRIIRDGVRKEFIRMEPLKEGQRLIEPVFILEIKLLFEIIKSKML